MTGNMERRENIDNAVRARAGGAAPGRVPASAGGEVGFIAVDEL